MKKTLALVMLLCIALGAQAQLLWKISGNGLDRPSYVMGTHHLAPLSIKDSIASMKQAMDETQQVYGELVMENAMKPDMLMKMQQAMMLPADTTLKSLFTPAEYDSIASVVKTYIGMDLALFDKLKPAALTTQLSVALAAKSVKGFNPPGKHGAANRRTLPLTKPATPGAPTLLCGYHYRLRYLTGPTHDRGIHEPGPQYPT